MLYSIKPEYNYMVDYYSVFLSMLAGLFSTLMMSLFELPFWRKWGLEGVLEWHENQVLYSKFCKWGIGWTWFLFFIEFGSLFKYYDILRRYALWLSFMGSYTATDSQADNWDRSI
jgi:hypothetical protein